MAQTDYVVRLLGKDQLSATLANVKTNLKDTGMAADRLDEIQNKFKKIAESTMPAKRQLREMQKLLGEMNIEGLDKTPVFTQMAERAGQLADAISDARRAVNAYANDNFKLEAGAQAFSTIATGAMFAKSTMELLGIENENVTNSIKKLQVAMTALNGVQQLANYLNKDSALMLRIKQAQLKGSTAYTSTLTAATMANTTATGVQTAAVTIATKARARLNQSIAIGKALLGDFSGVIMLGAAALTSYAIFSDNAKDATENLDDSLNKAKSSVQSFKDKVAESAGSAIGKFEALRIQWNSLKDTASKTQWIKDNQSAFSSLGMSINSVTDAENAFVNNTADVVKALQARAKAAAAQSLIEEEHKKYMIEGRETPTAKAGDRLEKNNPFFEELRDSKYSTNMFQLTSMSTEYYLTPEGAAKLNRLMKEQLKHNFDKTVSNLTAEMLSAMDETSSLNTGNLFEKPVKEPKTEQKEIIDPKSLKFAEDKVKELQDLRLKIPVDATEELERNEKEIKAWEKEVESRKLKIRISTDISPLKQAEDKLKELESIRISLNPDDSEAIKKVNEDIETIKTSIKSTKIKLGIEPNIEEGSITAIDEQIKKLEETLGRIDINLDPEKFQQLKTKLIELLDKKEELSKKLSTDSLPSITLPESKPRFEKGSIEDLRKSYENAMSQINRIGSDYGMKLINKEEAESQIKSIVEQLQSLIPDLEIKVKVNDDGTIDVTKKNLLQLPEALGNVGQAVNSLGGAMQNLAKDNEGLTKAAAITQAVGTLALTFAQAMKGTATPWDWIAGAVAGVATLTSVIGQLQSFESGGIVGGNSYAGDRLLVRANSGEMILNQRQQNNLFKAIDNGDINGGRNLNVSGEFRIKNGDLVAVLNNYNSKLKRQS